jgi:hypothetical protein
MIFFYIQNKTRAKTGWVHSDTTLKDALKAVLYQTGFNLADLVANEARVRFIFKDSIDLGTYEFASDEFQPSRTYSVHPEIANL